MQNEYFLRQYAPKLGYYSSLLAENSIHPIRSVRTLNNSEAGVGGRQKVLWVNITCGGGRKIAGSDWPAANVARQNAGCNSTM